MMRQPQIVGPAELCSSLISNRYANGGLQEDLMGLILFAMILGDDYVV